MSTAGTKLGHALAGMIRPYHFRDGGTKSCCCRVYHLVRRVPRVEVISVRERRHWQSTELCPRSREVSPARNPITKFQQLGLKVSDYLKSFKESWSACLQTKRALTTLRVVCGPNATRNTHTLDQRRTKKRGSCRRLRERSS